MRTLIVAIILFSMTAECDARFRWPWETPRHRVIHRHHIKKKQPRIIIQVQPISPPNCERIRMAIDELSPERLLYALRTSTKAQRQIIEKCRKEGE